MASTPATKVVATAPMPGIITPSLPFAGSIRPLDFELLRGFASEFLSLTTSTLAVFDFAFPDCRRIAIDWLLPQ
jgi:hypothetical protein